MTTIDICCPSRGRPHRAIDLAKSLAETSTGVAKIHLILCVEESEREAYEQNYPVPTTIITAKGNWLSDLWNQCFFAGSGEIVCHLGDDHFFETVGWDKMVLEFFEGKKAGMLYGMDGHVDERCASVLFLTRKSCEAVGYFLPPYFEADFNDLWLMEVYRINGLLKYDPRFMIRHNHRNANPDYDDETYKLSEPKRARAAKVWEEMQGQIPIDAEKLKQWIIH